MHAVTQWAYISLFSIMLMLLALPAMARDNVHMVGSSTVFQFATVAAEEFGRNSGYRTPFVESNGTGIGMEMFCSGIGSQYPDMSNASREIKPSELKRCVDNGITDIMEIKLGADGIVLANSKESPRYSLTSNMIFLALTPRIARNGELIDNPYHNWSDIDPSLPDIKIAVYGPKHSSGTRDAIADLIMLEQCKTYPEYAAVYTDKKQYKKACQMIREDNDHYIEVGEQDNVTVKKLIANPETLGFFGFSYYEQNDNIIQSSIIDGQKPTFESIANGTYPISRSLFIYVKQDHFPLIPGMQQFTEELVSEAALDPFDGYLALKGLISLPLAERDAMRTAIQQKESIVP